MQLIYSFDDKWLLQGGHSLRFSDQELFSNLLTFPGFQS